MELRFCIVGIGLPFGGGGQRNGGRDAVACLAESRDDGVTWAACCDIDDFFERFQRYDQETLLVNAAGLSPRHGQGQ